MAEKEILHVSEGQCEGSIVGRDGKILTVLAVIQTFKTSATDVLCSARGTGNQAHQCILYGFNNNAKCAYLKTVV